MKTVVAFGEALWDLLPTGPVLGGAPCNFAYRVNSLGDQGILVTRLGTDDLGRKALEEIQSLGMERKFIQRDAKHPTGTVPVKIDAKGVPDFTIVKDVAYDYIEPVDVQADAICFGTLVQRRPDSRRALRALLDGKGQGVKLLDINLRKECYTRETIEASLERADILKLNDSEALFLRKLFSLRGKRLAGLAREIRRRWSLDACVVTLGERGAIAATSEELVEVPGWKIDVADTVGSGDAFSAAFLHSWLKGRSLLDCCFFGNALGAMVARTKGATSPISVDEINRFSGRTI